MSDTAPPQTQVRHAWSKSDRFVPRAFVRPFQRFMDAEAGGAIIMLAAAVAALVCANSPWHEAYTELFATHLNVELGDLIHLELTLVEWINDALMAIFFFVVGLEIKRELVQGELTDPRKAALPAIAAVGGMVVPAAIYLLFNSGEASSNGWGIPMATDIAFAVAVVSLAGNRVPAAAKVFLLTLAIADDIGAILVIAVFYTDQLSLGWLATAVLGLVIVKVASRLDVRSLVVYVALAGLVWLALHESGVHATLAGVALGLLTPVWSFYDPTRFPSDARRLVERAETYAKDRLMTHDEYALNEAVLMDINRLTTETMSPLTRIEHKLKYWVAFLIVPLFAFANAGVRLTGEALGGLATDPVVLGIALGLIVGKAAGIFAFTFVTAKLGVGTLPGGVTWRHVLGLSATAGIGFTVALFITGLAFDDPALTDSAKIGILGGSLIAGLLGYGLLRTSEHGRKRSEDAEAGAASLSSEPALT